jgi:DUF1009 family protein
VAERIGLIAGTGELPLEMARAARREGRSVAGVAIVDLADPALEGELAECRWLHLGELGTLVAFFRAQGVRDLVMAGKVPKTILYGDPGRLRPDATALSLLGRLRDRKDDSILGAVAHLLEAEGFRLLAQTAVAPGLVAPRGALASRVPTAEQWEEIRFAWPVARALGRLDVGQSVVVRHRAVMALEAIEGTDEAIRRGGSLGGPGCCVVKVAKPGQDPRFDVPTVGRRTLATLAEVRGALLAVEAGASLVLGRAALAAEADAAGIAVVGVAPGDVAEEAG